MSFEGEQPSCEPSILGFGYNRASGNQQPSMLNGIEESARRRKKSLNPSSGSLGYRAAKLPFPVVPRRLREDLVVAYRLHQLSDPLSDEPMRRFAQLVKVNFQNYLDVYSKFLTSDHSELVLTIGEFSIRDPSFNNYYRKMHRRLFPLMYGHQTDISMFEFPIPDHIGFPVRTWRGLKEKLYFFSSQRVSPEILPSPNSLYPWVDDEPEGFELWDSLPAAENKLDMDTIHEVMSEIFQKPVSRIFTTADFAMAHINAKKCAKGVSLSRLRGLIEEKSKLTAYKYVEVTKWLDSGQESTDWFGIRTPVWKSPGEYRDAICVPPHQLYHLWLINSIMGEVLKHVKGASFSMSIPKIMRLRNKYSILIMTDWKKSGLTIPHWFVNLTIDWLRKCTDQDIHWKEEGWPVYDPRKDRWYYPKNFGYGLGMVNNINTLFNIVLFRYAQKKNIFTEEDSIESFNDDSIIGCSKNTYNQWLLVCAHSGGFIDKEKTFTSKEVGVFCETYGGFSLFPYKIISLTTTVVNSLGTAHNKTHWRFLVSGMCNSIWNLILEGKRQFSSREAENWIILLSFIKAKGEIEWQEVWRDLPFEMGGLNLTNSATSENGNQLVFWLISQEENPDTQREFKQNLLGYYEWLESKKEYRPWHPMPKGFTKDFLAYLGEMGGLQHALTAFRDKAKGAFVTSHYEYNKKEFQRLEHILSEYKRLVPIDFWDFVNSRQWPNYVPSPEMVSKVKPFGDQVIMMDVEDSPKEKRYSQAAHAENYIRVIRGEPTIFPKEQIDMGGRAFPLIKFLNAQTGYVESFHGPWLFGELGEYRSYASIMRDFISRTGSIPVELKSKDVRGTITLDFLRKVSPSDSIRDDLSNYDGASWWTRFPVPYKQPSLRIVSLFKPDIQTDVLVWLMRNPLPEDEDTVSCFLSCNTQFLQDIENTTRVLPRKSQVVEIQAPSTQEGDPEQPPAMVMSYHEEANILVCQPLAGNIDSVRAAEEWFEPAPIFEDPIQELGLPPLGDLPNIFTDDVEDSDLSDQESWDGEGSSSDEDLALARAWDEDISDHYDTDTESQSFEPP